MEQTICWRRQIYFLWFCQFSLMAALDLSTPFWSLLLLNAYHVPQTTLSIWLAALFAAPLLGTMISGPWWGRQADRLGPKLMVLRAAGVLTLIQIGLWWVSDPTLALLIRFAQGLLAGFTAAAQAYAMTAIPDHVRGRVLGQLQAASALGTLVGPLIGGWVIQQFSYPMVFLVAGGMIGILTLLLAIGLPSTRLIHKDAVKKHLNKLTKSHHIMLILISLNQMARMLVLPIFALFLIQRIHTNTQIVGVLYAVTGLTFFLTTPWWGRLFDKLRFNAVGLYLLLAILALSAFLQFAHIFTSDANVIFALRAVWGICLGGLLPIFSALCVRVEQTAGYGHIVGYIQRATKFGNLLGITLSGALLQWGGFSSIFIVMAGIYMLMGVILIGFYSLQQQGAPYSQEAIAE